jgi:hypothetical protein
MRTDKVFLFVLLCFYLQGPQVSAKNLEKKYRTYMQSSFELSKRVLDIKKRLETGKQVKENKSLDKRIDQLNRIILHASDERSIKYSAGKIQVEHYDQDMSLITLKLLWSEEIKTLFPETKKVKVAYMFAKEKEARQLQSKKDRYFYVAFIRKRTGLYIVNIYINKIQQFFLHTYKHQKKIKRNKIYMMDYETERLREAISSVDGE